MAIPQTKYVNIISAVGGQSQVSQRDLIGRVFTDSELIPVGSVLEFVGLDAVGEYFGLESDEYAFASKYFGYTSRSGNKPQKISFALHATSARPAILFGGKRLKTIDVIKTYTNVNGVFKINGTTYNVSNVSFASATSYGEVAAIVQSALNTATTTSIATVEYDEELGRFSLKTNATTDASLDYVDGGIGDLLQMRNISVGTILSEYSAPADSSGGLSSLVASYQISNNFYSFTFLTTIAFPEKIAEWVHNQNVRYMWSLGVSYETMDTILEAVSQYDGIGLTLNDDCVFLPMAIAAAINYEQPNASVDFMYQQAAGITPEVLNSGDSTTLDIDRINYYGSTMVAGKLVSFYQNGVLQGSISSMGVHVNEAWLKDAIATNLLNLRLSLDTLPANETGLAYVKSSILEIINKAVNNGVISVGKTLDSAQKTYIGQITGDKDAWMAVQSAGYWFAASVEKYTQNETEKYKVTYLLVYGKGDSINYIDGKDILI